MDDVRHEGDGLRLRVTVTGATIEAVLGKPGSALPGVVVVEDAAAGVLLATWATGMRAPVSRAQVRVTSGGVAEVVFDEGYTVHPRLVAS